ncbi:EVE domain-containing protein [Polaribacter sp. R2A056_3_33]|uniref:EVE domain-containing protein n=1 Tax=Polaribacter sp. R2A056_3_33 TaxID=2745563 RepID=UPI001C4F0D3D|nr:EVE domain-containing protein [Polaribacter sp. R2A056_3_33]QXP71265.1 EVE domain-containing protein [Polaribacter sp. R2A056_3_33]
MINYKDYEKKVYDWLMQKHEVDPSFTFSLRQNASKGTELDYFIGTEKSNYFGITFWTLPISYPGSSSDCINLIFESKNDYYTYKFEFTQTNSPQDAQNKSALNLIEAIETPIKEKIVLQREGSRDKKMFAYVTKQRTDSYTDLNSMLGDIEKDLEIIIPIINKHIQIEKKENSEFEAHRISTKEFQNMQAKLKKRFEKYGYINKNVNYWIFQGTPDIYNITNALKAAHLKSWKVAAHKDKIKIGDKVIIWQTGKNAGCYALAEVISEVSVFEEEPHEQWYYTNKSDASATDRVKIKITDYYADSPISDEDIKGNPCFYDFKAGNQGTNFNARKEQYEEIKSLFNSKNSFEKVRSKLDPSIFEEFISFVRSLIKTFNLKPNDPRIVFSVRGYKLNFIVGQKYCVNVYSSKNKQNFGLISTDKLSNNNEKFAGKSPQTFYNYLDSLVVGEKEKQNVLEAVESVLDKTTKSGYSKSNDIEFQNYVFQVEANEEKNMKPATNQILYGPPGTGKTFYLKDQLFDRYTLKENAITKEKFFEDKITNLTWWQVIAIALIENGTSKVNDILENRWVKTKASLSESKNVRATIWGTLQMHTITSSENVAYKQRQNPLIFDKNNDKMWQLLEEETKEQIPEVYDIIDEVNNFKSNNETVIKNYDFVTFHQSFAYEDFIEGIKPVFPETEEETKDLGYKIEDGVFKKLCIKAKNDPSNRYAIFIDEINRGNVSAIFGELITLIETDKRSGAKNEMSIKLPYSKKEFSVPSNLDIYGTMNTADRSVEALDTALRRRFEFKEMMPDYTVIENEEVDYIKLSEVLKKINERIELLIDRDHAIGHSYFCKVNSEEKLAKAFNTKIVPLLQEYFYGDYGKIGLVLGKGFVEKEKNDAINFADFSYENSNDFKAPSYLLKQVNEDNVIEAVLSLLGKKQAE